MYIDDWCYSSVRLDIVNIALNTHVICERLCWEIVAAQILP